MADSPAFQFYPADYTIGTKFMTPAERGVYVDCLCHQWDEGAIPGDSIRDLAVVMRCSEREAKALWVRVSTKFERGEDGQWRNARLESERAKQMAYRKTQAEKGRKGAGSRWQKDGRGDGTGHAPAISVLVATVKPKDNRTDDRTMALQSSSSSSITSSKNDDVASAGRGFPLTMSPLRYEKLKQSFRHVGARLRVPHVLHDELVTKLGGDDPDGRLVAWYAQLDADVERTKEPIPDVFVWLRPKFVEWSVDSTTDAAMAAWVAGA